MEQVRKYNHGEAFMWMYYSNDDGTVGHWIYNTRDGVTPFNVTIAGVTLQHRHWKFDLCQPDYKPKQSDFVWRTWTREEAERTMRKNVTEHPEFLWGRDPEEIVNHAGEEAEKMHHPCLAVVDESGNYILYEK